MRRPLIQTVLDVVVLESTVILCPYECSPIGDVIVAVGFITKRSGTSLEPNILTTFLSLS